jgi:hypothetical protein
MVLYSLLEARQEVMGPRNQIWRFFLSPQGGRLSSLSIGSLALILITYILLWSSFPRRTSLLVRQLRFVPNVLLLIPSIAYYNEARILDPTTFATIKVLPNMPGAVNDCEVVHHPLLTNANIE